MKSSQKFTLSELEEMVSKSTIHKNNPYKHGGISKGDSDIFSDTYAVEFKIDEENFHLQSFKVARNGLFSFFPKINLTIFPFTKYRSSILSDTGENGKSLQRMNGRPNYFNVSLEVPKRGTYMLLKKLYEQQTSKEISKLFHKI
jgi:hypothetical protein